MYDWSTIKKGEYLYEKVNGGAVEIEVLSDSRPIDGGWEFDGKIYDQRLTFMYTNTAYAPDINDFPHYLPVTRLDGSVDYNFFRS